jgi:hypothetical protein
LNQPVHKRARVVRVSLSPIDDPRKNKQKHDVIPLEKSKKFEVKKFETIENSKHEEREGRFTNFTGYSVLYIPFVSMNKFG